MPMNCEGYSSEANKEMDAIMWRYSAALANATLFVATSNGRKSATVEDVKAAAHVVAESKPTYIEKA